MKRRDFIKQGCTACLTATSLAAVISSCKPTHYISGTLHQDGLLVNIKEFETSQQGKQGWRPYIIVRNEALIAPVCIYRFSDTDYSALWMKCTHQGAELLAAGSYLQCPAHGSEFDSKGQVTSGPAITNLRSFPVTVNNDQLFIDLRKK